MYQYFIYFFGSLLLTIQITKIWLKFSESKEDVKDILAHHQHKNKTPNRGGICIFLGLLPIFFFTKNYILLGISTYGLLIGLLDDIKKNTGGLNNRLRIFLWSLMGLVVAYYRYSLYGGIISIPIINAVIDLKYFYLLFAGIFVFLGSINGINMTDGLDGMVTFPLILNGLFISIVACFSCGKTNLLLLSGGFTGALMGFLYMNINKAKIFMGDCGSVFLGMLLASMFMLLKLECFFLITGVIFAVNLISSFLQIISLTFFKKRIFKMAPLHHHFELLGHKETTIVFYVWWWSIVAFAVGIGLYFHMRF
jgi:phospho-N-acetylmuramoyl-pentapeptide-transferase